MNEDRKLNSKILDFLNKTAGQLTFALLSGLGYFMLLAGGIIEMSRGMWILLLYLAPVIICGAALVIIKMIKAARENENNASILKIFWLHIVVILIGIVFIVALFVN